MEKKPTKKKKTPQGETKPAKRETKKPKTETKAVNRKTKPAPKKKVKRKKKKTKKRKETDEQKAAREEQEKALAELKAQSEYEKKNELAEYVGWGAYKKAKGMEERLRALAVVGSVLRGDKRGEIRKRFRLSPNRLNQILSSDYIKDVISYSLGYLFSMQNACLGAIMNSLTEEKDGRLALILMEKLGMFKQHNIDAIMGEGDLNEEEAKQAAAEQKDQEGDFAGYTWLQAGQAPKEVQQLIQHLVRSHPNHSGKRN